MTCRDTLQCIHEPFGDAFYYGPERLSSRYESDEKGRMVSGFSNSTFKTILDRIEKEGAEVRITPSSSEDLDYGVLTHFQGKRLFIKDIIHYLVPPNRAPPSIAPSLLRKERGVGTPKTRTNGVSDSTADVPYPYQTDVESGNPTVIPNRILDQFHFTFLIRHPRYSIPSYYRCTVPPLDKITGFYDFMPSEAGYDELRRVFDYLRSVDQIGPHVATQEIAYTEENGNSFANGRSGAVDICVVDADDLLDHPAKVIKTYCDSVGIAYDQTMLNWNSEEDRHQARDAFKKWPGFHEDAVNSCDLKPRMHKKKSRTNEEEDSEWLEKFGAKGAKVIREAVNANVKDYEYLKHFALKV
ncbi:hypothetical protein MMC28_010818 [Mycoblastus sanguinarius]|nr:hypothetical protein [Mycoblastus sanguinarius]